MLTIFPPLNFCYADCAKDSKTVSSQLMRFNFIVLFIFIFFSGSSLKSEFKDNFSESVLCHILKSTPFPRRCTLIHPL